ncbi:hypothetical protein MNBD_ALPHA04-673 [hydrothermal vent metagenome]|uniref:Uncharacterized protein n=1 Tax=hydrothermal vent metagenome TaxID=652676 RepID=A0A3B0SAT2_9ZZZZ
MNDPLSQYNDALSSPARRAFMIVPDDVQELVQLPKCICVGGAGDIILRAVDSSEDVTVTVQSGQLIPVRASHVRAAGTTATGLVALA